MEIKNGESNLCRLCAATMECACEENNLFQLDNLFVHQQIKELAGVTIENDPEMPRYFCENCKIQLTQAYEFRKHLIEVHKFFKKKYKNNLQSGQPEVAQSIFDAIFIPDKIEEYNTEINSISEDLCELENNALNDFDSIEAHHTEEEEIKSIVKTKKTKSKRFPAYRRKRKKKTDPNEKGDSFICEQCGMSFKTMKFLEIHSVRHEERKFQCDICSAKFFLPTELKRHQISHTGEKPVACRFCNTRFLNKSNRNRHEKSQHLKLRPYPCDLCGKAFGTSHLRKNHMLVHTKERAFDCQLCKKSFLRKNHLVTHYKSTAHKKNEMDSGNHEIQNL